MILRFVELIIPFAALALWVYWMWRLIKWLRGRR